MKTYRITITLAPLSELECHRALDAINQYWRRPEQLSRKPWQGAFILTASAEMEMSVLETERLFGKRISSAIWRRLGRYVRVTVDFTGIDADNNSLLEFDESHYREAMSIR
ncbi:hypothetical protein LIN78_12780 [Leeia sp. TBRC 13508]|uniref:Uncharacterized protein n=1 Tax=Leeia speluncae TaxID=2884804 RepID=A0ABS8D904_9NEIS|nr:hypothetical protein [Leeia speluncae]MCB6184421.1 hypothetical protein [Leeia speluncae]